MLKQLPIKKEYLLLIGTVLLLVICYRFGFQRTLEAWQVNKSLKQQVNQASDVTELPQYQLRKNSNLEKLIGLYKGDTVAFRSSVLTEIASMAEKEHVKLSGVPLKDPLYHGDKFIIQKLDFDGDYFSLVKFLARLQSSPNTGMVRAATLKTTTINNSGGKVVKLGLEVYLEITTAAP